MTDHAMSDLVGANVRKLRRAKELTVAQLAERTNGQVTAASITNIELGRRDENGVRRRDITVDELIVLAGALSVGPTVLLPSLAGTMEYSEDEAETIMNVILGNMEVMRKFIDSRHRERDGG